MGFNVQTFQAALTDQGARPNLFDMTITPPTNVLTLATATTLQYFTTMCKTAQIPGSTIGVVEVQYFGRPVKMPGNRTFENLTTTIINDEGFVLRNSMEAWMAFLNSHQANKTEVAGGSAGLNYTGTLVIQQYNRDGSFTSNANYTFNKCWPVNVAPIDLDWGTNDTIEEFTIEWAYDWWSSDASASA